MRISQVKGRNGAIVAALLMLLSGCVTSTGSGGSSPLVPSTPEISLQIPVGCTLGEDCWVIASYDHDRGEGRRDYACRMNPIQDTRSTAFGLANERRIQDWVPVYAAAAGTVIGTRDSMLDINVREIGEATVRGRECGNGVRLDHGVGWTTQYCHMKLGSIVVSAGERVAAGTVLGHIGMSGGASFPHLGLRVQKNGVAVDPFIGLNGGPPCALGHQPLWAENQIESLQQSTPIIMEAGFADRVLKGKEISKGVDSSPSFSRASPAVVLWVSLARPESGDVVGLYANGPKGRLFASTHRFETSRALASQSYGVKIPKSGWTPGEYIGTVVILRDGVQIAERKVTMTLTD